MKSYILICLLILMSSTLFAKVEVSAGGRVGFNIAHIRKIDVPTGYKKKINLGSNFGGTLRLNFNDFIGIQTEILFAQKGQQFFQKTDSTKQYKRFVNNFIEVPILAVVRFGSEKVKFVGFAGPYLAYWSGAYTQESLHSEKMTQKTKSNDYKFLKSDSRFDMGIATGIGADIKVGNGWLEIAARHDLGLMSRTKSSPKNFNCNFNLSIGYLFTITKKNDE